MFSFGFGPQNLKYDRFVQGHRVCCHWCYILISAFTYRTCQNLHWHWSILLVRYFKIPYQFNEEKKTAGLRSHFLSLLYKNIPNKLLSFLSFLIVI